MPFFKKLNKKNKYLVKLKDLFNKVMNYLIRYLIFKTLFVTLAGGFSLIFIYPFDMFNFNFLLIYVQKEDKNILYESSKVQ